MRKQIIEETLKRITGIGLVIIDDLQDLILDINFLNEPAEIINLLMR